LSSPTGWIHPFGSLATLQCAVHRAHGFASPSYDGFAFSRIKGVTKNSLSAAVTVCVVLAAASSNRSSAKNVGRKIGTVKFLVKFFGFSLEKVGSGE
jgi:hypothetical protein